LIFAPNKALIGEDRLEANRGPLSNFNHNDILYDADI
jgi:hypothetical protein